MIKKYTYEELKTMRFKPVIPDQRELKPGQ